MRGLHHNTFAYDLAFTQRMRFLSRSASDEESRASKGSHPRHSDRSAGQWRNLPPRPAAQPPTQQQSFLVGAERRRISLTLVRTNSHSGMGTPWPSRKLRLPMWGCSTRAARATWTGLSKRPLPTTNLAPTRRPVNPAPHPKGDERRVAQRAVQRPPRKRLTGGAVSRCAATACLASFEARDVCRSIAQGDEGNAIVDEGADDVLHQAGLWMRRSVVGRNSERNKTQTGPQRFLCIPCRHDRWIVDKIDPAQSGSDDA